MQRKSFSGLGRSLQAKEPRWTRHQAMKDKFSQLFSFTRKLKCSIRFFLNQEMSKIFSPTVSLQAISQLDDIQHILNEDTNDRWTCNWGTSKFCSKRAYCAMTEDMNVSPLFKWLWACSNLGNQKFSWLLIRDRLNTRNILKRKRMQLDDYSCVLCSSNIEESSFHLFFECNFSKDCWASIPIDWNLNIPHP